ncbi:hypothetical protein KRR40_21940 [Niabella defluvii]|nr:hypothetical protein KRR40_21940 [Niabella sp. I65]
MLIFSQNKNYNVTAAKLQAYLSQGLDREQPELPKATRLYLQNLPGLRRKS